jgi:protein-L-isoaspartate(D-aspartate) O-methyltransferase
MMLEMLKPQKGDYILDIGSGSGWTTALLAYIIKENGFVTGLERIDELVEFGSYNLAKYNFNNAKIVKAEDKLGIPSKRFDKILVSAAAETFPYMLLDQLKPNGKLVIPVQNSVFEVKKDQNGDIIYKEHYGFSFVPLIT